jgi:hypothetical protein
MGHIHSIVRILFLTATLAASGASAIDLGSCADDLDRLRRAASDATDKANDAKTKQEELQTCKNDSYSYDRNYDGCRSKASYFQSAAGDLKSELDTIDSRLRSIRSSCGYDLTMRQRDPSTGDEYCDMIRGYRKRLPYQNLVAICSQSMAEDDCRKCLAFKPYAPK